MRCAWFLGLTGCSAVFGLEAPSRAIDAAPPDTKIIVDGAVDATVVPNCTNDSNLVACFEFEGVVKDLAPSANAVTATNVTYTNSGKSGAALVVDPASRIRIGDSVLLDVPSVTIEAWIYMTAAPAPNTRAGILDVNGQYGVFIQSSLALTCTAGTPFDSGAINLNEWTHIACAAGGGSSHAYINGAVTGASVYPGSSLPTTPTDGGEIAGNSPDEMERFTGRLDVLRVYRVARTAEEICADAGRSGCL